LFVNKKQTTVDVEVFPSFKKSFQAKAQIKIQWTIPCALLCF